MDDLHERICTRYERDLRESDASTTPAGEGVSLSHATHTAGQMSRHELGTVGMPFKTYEEADKWLKSIGGTVRISPNEMADFGVVIVSVLGMERMHRFSSYVEGPAREKAEREAFCMACDALRANGAEQMVRSRER